MISREKLKTPALILRLYDYGEADRIVTFFSRDFGKLKGIAKGARKSRKRFANTLELFCLSEIIFSLRDRDALAILEDSRIIDHHVYIRNDLEKTLLASYMLELTDHFTREGKTNPHLYDLVINYLGLLNHHALPPGMIHFFELGLLKCTGYEPVLDRCLQCREPVTMEALYMFSPREGGLKCDSCRKPSPEAFPVSLGTIKTILHGQGLSIEKLNQLFFSNQTRKEGREIFARFIEHILGKPVKSYLILNEMGRYFDS